jgi:hypothetical protein
MPLLLLLGHPLFSNYSFLAHHHVNRDDRHLLTRAMASDWLARTVSEFEKLCRVTSFSFFLNL